MLRRLGGLTTRGRCLLAAGLAAALCAVIVDERDLLRVAVFAVALPLLASVVVGRTQIMLRADRELMPSRTSVGGDCRVHLTLLGTGRCSGRLLLEDVVPEALGGPRRAVVARMPHRAVQLIYPIRPTERQVHLLGPLIVRITDPLGLAVYRRTLAEHGQLVVIPAVMPLAGSPAGGRSESATAGGGPAAAGSGQDAVVVRSYRQGDDLRKVHWRTTARRDELMVRVEEWSQRSGVTVLLDHRAAAHRGSGSASSLEYAVSLAASMYVHLRQRDPQVRLVTVDAVVRAGADDTIVTALDTLAALTPTDQRGLANIPETAGRHEVIAVLGAVEPAVVGALLGNHLQGGRGHAVLLDVAAWATDKDGRVAPDPAKAAQLLATAGWSATVAGPEHPPASVWDQLCLSSQSSPWVPR